jgi:hypothetical protein
MGDVGRVLPVEIPQVPFHGEARMAAQQKLGGFCCFL